MQCERLIPGPGRHLVLKGLFKLPGWQVRAPARAASTSLHDHSLGSGVAASAAVPAPWLAAPLLCSLHVAQGAVALPAVPGCSACKASDEQTAWRLLLYDAGRVDLTQVLERGRPRVNNVI